MLGEGGMLVVPTDAEVSLSLCLDPAWGLERWVPLTSHHTRLSPSTLRGGGGDSAIPRVGPQRLG